jgi:hypothetical protein
MAAKKSRVKTYGTIKEDGWTWKAVSWHIYGPWAEEFAAFLRENGLHVKIKEKRIAMRDPDEPPDREYHVFVPENELAPVPGLIAQFQDR